MGQKVLAPVSQPWGGGGSEAPRSGKRGLRQPERPGVAIACGGRTSAELLERIGRGFRAERRQAGPVSPWVHVGAESRRGSAAWEALGQGAG